MISVIICEKKKLTYDLGGGEAGGNVKKVRLNFSEGFRKSESVKSMNDNFGDKFTIVLQHSQMQRGEQLSCGSSA
ncbi:MAG: hypothetical protein ABI462_10445 [Ignavibacteria bacterium]